MARVGPQRHRGEKKKYHKNIRHTNITAGSLRLCSQSMWISFDEEATEM